VTVNERARILLAKVERIIVLDMQAIRESTRDCWWRFLGFEARRKVPIVIAFIFSE